ncbi:MAG: secondary thiamine-phosphate synthase enzyme YjbQ [Opitutaceae bacterium]
MHQARIEVPTRGTGLYEVTGPVRAELRRSGLRAGLASVFCRHTSCSLVLMENASSDARRDLQRFLDRLVPPDAGYEHDLEGADDMPSHIKMALTRSSETIPFSRAELSLGTWQGL